MTDMFRQIAVLRVKIQILVLNCCLKVFDVIYPCAFDDVKLNKLDATLLNFVAYISV